MIETREVTYVLLSKAGRLLSTNPSPATLWRWALKGVDGVKLETFKIGGRRYTSPESVEQFVARLNIPRTANEPRLSSLRERQINLASRRARDIYK